MKKRSLFAAAAVVAGSLTAPIFGATLTWTGAAGSLWTSAGNWTGGGIPSAVNNVLVFPGGGVTMYTTDTGVDQAVADLTFNAANAYTVNNNSLSLGGTFTQQGAGTVGINSAVFLQGATAFNGGVATGETIFGGVVSGAATPSFNGGRWVFTNNASSFSGGMNINAGATVEARGNGRVTVAAGRLTGNGTIVAPAGSPFTVGALATVAPGNGPGALAVQGDINFNAGAIFEAEINKTIPAIQYDQLGVAGGISLDANAAGGAVLNVVVNAPFFPTVGSTFTIIANDGTNPVTGSFAGLPEGGIVASTGQPALFTISYAGGDGNDVVLTAAVPEPATISALGLAAVGLLGRRRRKF